MQNQIQGFQLSPQQRRLWLLQQQDSLAYRAQCAILIEGNLKAEILKSALQKVINRNEILRTTFHRTHGIRIPIQVIASSSILSLSNYNLDTWNYQEQETKISALFQEASQQPFDLEQGSLLHTTLITLSPSKHVLLASLPAMIADKAALNNLVLEISRCLSACLQGEELSSEPLQYADIAQWQNELLEAEETEAGREYLRQPDISALETFKLGSENRLSGKPEFEPKFLTLPIHPDLVTKIEAIAQKYKTSAAVFFLTCWQILLWRLTGQSDLIVGTGFDCRNYEELKEALGLFAKYLPLPCHLEDNYSFSDVLAQVNKFTGELSEWQESFAWEPIAESNEHGMELSFFPFCFEFEEAPAKYSAANISFSIYKQYVCFDRFKVKLSCLSTEDDSVNAEFHYDANVFAKEDIQRLASQFETLLASVVKNPSAAIAQLDILSQSERSQLKVEFNNTKTAAPQHQCIHHWIEQQCDRTPDNIAVVFNNQQLTYRELNARANQLAHHLQHLGVGTEVIVGICVERSLLMVIGLLGILKAGGAYVPIDPTLPLDRKTFIIADTQTPILLTQQSIAAEVPTDGIKVICLDTDWEIMDQERVENPVSETTALNLAYVIYTSGSTGKPKGTLIPHRGLVNYLSWCTQAYAVEKGSGTLVHTPLGFDLTITSLFSPLLVGSQVELLPEDNGIDTLSDSLRHNSKLSLVKITPAHLELLSQQLSHDEAAGRTQAFIIGGENLLANSITFWQDVAPDTMLVNEYGPTETVVGCCIYQVPTGQHFSGSIPIGRPIANTQLYVLDQYCQLVPIGVVGELHIGGLGLARGYLNQPELTAEKFIPNPFSDEPGERLYKTGDLVRYGLDGTLEFLGRLDDQVKIRGFRIELGEISAVLSGHPGVKESVVLAREDVPGDQRLVAYIVLNQESSFSISELRSFLKEKLPDYMVPSAFVPLSALPLTRNGKVDRQALPAPDTARPEFEGLFVAPRNSIEERLAGIWAEVLRLERVGIHDNFFDLGGHSLLATQLMSRLRDAFQVELLLRQIFDAPTVADLAAIVTQKLAEQAGDDEILAQTLAELEQLSENEVQVVLADRKQSIGEKKSNE